VAVEVSALALIALEEVGGVKTVFGLQIIHGNSSL
jgi:hypothetical protein